MSKLNQDQIMGLRLAETLIMAELFGKSENEIINEAKEISEKTLKEPLHLTNPKLTHRYYCLAKELKRRGFNFPVFDFIEDLEIHLEKKWK